LFSFLSLSSLVIWNFFFCFNTVCVFIFLFTLGLVNSLILISFYMKQKRTKILFYLKNFKLRVWSWS
jgi:hypothetical protein